MGPPGDLVFEGHALQVLHGDKRLAVLPADVVNGADVGVIQRRSCLGLTLEASQGLGVASHVVGQKFQGNKTEQAGVLRFVHHSHAAAAQFLEDLIVGNGFADHEGLAILWTGKAPVNRKLTVGFGDQGGIITIRTATTESHSGSSYFCPSLGQTSRNTLSVFRRGARRTNWPFRRRRITTRRAQRLPAAHLVEYFAAVAAFDHMRSEPYHLFGLNSMAAQRAR